MPSVLDKLGQEIQEGSYIVYGHALGRSAGLKVGRVLKVLAVDTSRVHGYHSGYRITVVGVDENSWPPSTMKLGKKGTLQYPDRCLVIPDATVPSSYRELLEKSS